MMLAVRLRSTRDSGTRPRYQGFLTASPHPQHHTLVLPLPPPSPRQHAHPHAHPLPLLRAHARPRVPQRAPPSPHRPSRHARIQVVGSDTHAPAGAVQGADFVHHLVDLFEGEALCLGHEGEGEEGGEEAGGAPYLRGRSGGGGEGRKDGRGGTHKVDAAAQVAAGGGGVFDEQGGEGGDDGVPEPVACGGDGDAFGADGEVEDFADDDPGGGAPGGGEEEDVHAAEDDEHEVGGGGGGVAGPHGGDGEFAGGHAEGAVDEEGAAAEALDGVEGDGGADDVDEVVDDADDEGLADADDLEEGGVVAGGVSGWFCWSEGGRTRRQS